MALSLSTLRKLDKASGSIWRTISGLWKSFTFAVRRNLRSEHFFLPTLHSTHHEDIYASRTIKSLLERFFKRTIRLRSIEKFFRKVLEYNAKEIVDFEIQGPRPISRQGESRSRVPSVFSNKKVRTGPSLLIGPHTIRTRAKVLGKNCTVHDGGRKEEHLVHETSSRRVKFGGRWRPRDLKLKGEKYTNNKSDTILCQLHSTIKTLRFKDTEAYLPEIKISSLSKQFFSGFEHFHRHPLFAAPKKDGQLNSLLQSFRSRLDYPLMVEPLYSIIHVHVAACPVIILNGISTKNPEPLKNEVESNKGNRDDKLGPPCRMNQARSKREINPISKGQGNRISRHRAPDVICLSDRIVQSLRMIDREGALTDRRCIKRIVWASIIGTQLCEEWALANSRECVEGGGSAGTTHDESEDASEARFTLKYLGSTLVETPSSEEATAEAIKTVITMGILPSENVSWTAKGDGVTEPNWESMVVCDKSVWRWTFPNAKASGRKLQRVSLAVSLKGIRMTDLATEEDQLQVSIYRWV
ncbi:hypothetical protein WN51_01741 [Melipona quadrifasciata]|uniref:Uncharacterized protein n=1 Tax=Melipona quadrifasciata TaxID=166423 RepID=A0A0M8ZUX2_9HYME|nr:hypothetical protein WN51_01741 [Melipona quadrifasciata]